MKTSLLLLFFLFYAFHGNSQKIHLILVADEESNEFGLISKKDEDLIFRIFNIVEIELGYKMQTTSLIKSEFTSVAVKNTIINLHPQPSDIIVFYYNGLGFFPENTQSEFPSFNLNDKAVSPLSLDEVGVLLNQSGARLALAIAECRSEILDQKSKKWPINPTERLDNLIIRKIFLESCGLLKVSSLRKGKGITSAAYKLDNASVFTTSLDDAFSNILASSNHNMIDEMDLNYFIEQIRFPLIRNFATNMYVPHWTFTPYTDSRTKLITKSPSFKNVPALEEVRNELDKLFKEKNIQSRIIIINKLKNYFVTNATGFLVTKIQSSPQTEPTEKKLTIETFLEGLKQPNPKSDGFFLTNSSFKRTKDFMKFTEFEFVEVLQ